ncbi:MAG: FixH family protein [Alphaproteobacteria bacterium]|nr:FixH family protein [Alphaproteobacteria bacterium]
MSTSPRPRGWWYPYIFVGGFGVVLTVNVIMIYFATSTFTGLETVGAYDKGIRYNQTLAGAEAQRKLGWAVTVEATTDAALDPKGEPVAAVTTVTFQDAAAKPVEGLDVAGLFVRPTVAGHDSKAVFQPIGPGRYQARLILPFPGQWDLQLLAVRGELEYQLSERVVLR